MSDEMQKAAVALRENRVGDALPLLQGIVARTPDDFAANHMLGVALGKAGRMSESIGCLLKATRLNPQHAAAQTHLGLAYAGAGNTERARASYQAALAADPNFAPAQNALAQLPAPSAPTAAAAPSAAPFPAMPAAPPPKVASVATIASSSTPWSATSNAPQNSALPVATNGPKKGQSMRDEIDDAKKRAKAEAKLEKVGIDWGPMMTQIMGGIIFVVGLLLRVGLFSHQTGYGGFRAYRLEGYIVMAIGAAVWKFGSGDRDMW